MNAGNPQSLGPSLMSGRRQLQNPCNVYLVVDIGQACPEHTLRCPGLMCLIVVASCLHVAKNVQCEHCTPTVHAHAHVMSVHLLWAHISDIRTRANCVTGYRMPTRRWASVLTGI